MSSLVIAGDTSGSVTLQAPAVSGSTVLTLPSTSGTVMAPATAGTSGQFLTSSAGGAPTWTTPAGSALVLLSTITASNSATVDFENISSTYDTYMVVGNNIRSEFFTLTNLRARPKLDGSFTPSASARYVFVGLGLTNGTGTPAAINGNTEGSDTFVQMTAASTVGASNFANGTSFTLMLYGPMDAESAAKQGTFQSVSRAPDTNAASFMNGSMSFGTSNFVCGPMTGIRFYLNSGNIVSGVFRIYGMSKT